MERIPPTAQRQLENRKNLTSSSDDKVGITSAPRDTPLSQEIKQEPKLASGVPPVSKITPPTTKLQDLANENQKSVAAESQAKEAIAQANEVLDNSVAVNTVYNNGAQPNAPSFSAPAGGIMSPSQFPPAIQPVGPNMATASGIQYPLPSAARPNGNPESEVMLQCLAGIIKSLLPPPPPPACTKGVYLGIPCNADRKCIDKFLGQKRTNNVQCQPCCRLPPKDPCDPCKPPPCNPCNKPCACVK